jgi:hypothetical protein
MQVLKTNRRDVTSRVESARLERTEEVEIYFDGLLMGLEGGLSLRSADDAASNRRSQGPVT